MRRIASNRKWCWGAGLCLFLCTALVGCDRALKLQVRTEPAGADVYWNTQSVGTSPCVIVLPPEQPGFPEVQVFEIRKSGYEPTFHYLTTRPEPSLKGEAEIAIRLQKLPEGVSDADVPEALPFVPYNERAQRQRETTGLVACEVRLVRVRDGRVLCQVSGMGQYDQLSLFAEALAEELKEQFPPGRNGELAVATTRNRRQSERGEFYAQEMSQYLFRELSFDSPLGVATELNLTGLVSEDKKDNPRIVLEPALRKELRGVRYVVLSGLAEGLWP
mgnify:CR=1 FL=1